MPGGVENLERIGKGVAGIGEAAKNALPSIRELNAALKAVGADLMPTVEEMNRALSALGAGPDPKTLETRFAPTMRVVGATREQLRMLSADVVPAQRAVIEATNQLMKAHDLEAGALKNVTITLDKYANQLRMTADVQERISYGAQRLGETAAPGYITAPLPEVVVPLRAADVQQYNAVQAEMIKLLGGAERGFKRATAISKEYGLGIEHLTRAHQDAANGVTKFNWELNLGQGVVRTASIHIDKMGNVLEDTSTRFRSNTAMIVRNIGKVMQWAIAVGAVYGAIRRIHTVIDDMKDLELAFADIAIVTGQSGAALEQYYVAALAVAKETGITLKDVVNVYDDVLRVTTNIADEGQRLATANQLLADSATLARLANVTMVQSYDMLLGALRQAGLELDQGMVLLDKWVGVSRQAGLSVEDMAQSFAIAADIMNAAGVDIDRFNGMIAVLQEATTLSATQVGNALRAMASTYTTERSVQVLRDYGVAVMDLEGNYRSLWEVLLQISAMYETGVLSESQVKAIAEAMGGGQRRAAQVMTIISGMANVQEKAAVSSKSMGEAEEALAKKTDTLITSMNNLTTSFQDLAKTIGVEGGLLESLSGLVDLLSNAINFVTDLTEVLGPLTSQLIQLGAMVGIYSLASGWTGMANLAGMIGGFGMPGMPTGVGRRAIGQGGVAGTVPWATAGGRWLPQREWSLTQRMMVGGIGLGERLGGRVGIGGEQLQGAVAWLANPRNLTGVFTVAAMAAAPILTEGFTAESTLKSAGTAIGGGIGLALSGPLAGLIGASIGGAIVDVIFALMEAHREWERVYQGPLGELTEAELEARLERSQQIVERAGYTGPQRWTSYQTEAARQERLRTARLDIAAIEGEYERREEAALEAIDVETNAYEAMMAEISELNQEHISEIQTMSEIRLEALQKFTAGEITRKEYKDMIAAAEKATTVVGQLFYHLGEDIGLTYGEIFDILRTGSTEALDELLSRIAELNSLRARGVDIEDEIARNLDAHPGALDEMYQALARNRREVEDTEEAAKMLFGWVQKTTALDVPRFMKMDISSAELQQYIQDAMQMMAEFAAFAGIEVQALWEDAMYYAFTSDGTWNRIHPEVNRQFLQMAIQLGEAVTQAFSLERLKDFDVGMFERLVARTRYWEQFFQRIGKPLEQEEIHLILGPENIYKMIIASQDALRYAIDDLTEIEEKRMLEGMWNIPPGATFMVPITSLFYQRQQAEGGIESWTLPEGLPEAAAEVTTTAGTVSDAGTSFAHTLWDGGAAVREFTDAINRGAVELGERDTLIERRLRLGYDEEEVADLMERRLELGYGDRGPGAANQAIRDAIERTSLQERESIGQVADAIRTQPIDVQIPPVMGSFEITNVIYLDGQYIKDYITRVMAQSLRRDLRGGVSPSAANSPTTGWIA